MFSTQWSAAEWAKRQYLFKMNANITMFTILIVLQVIATVFIGGASTSSTFGSDDSPAFAVHLATVSYEGQAGMTMFWAFVVGFLLTSAAQRNESFVFVSNRWTFQLANLYFICTAALFGGVTTILLGSVMKIIALVNGNAIVETSGLLASPYDFFSRIVAMTGYTLLLLLLGYLIGTLIQWNRLFVGLFAVLWVMMLMTNYSIAIDGQGGLIDFFYSETSMLLFAVKVLAAGAVLFFASFLVANRLEVKQS